MSNFANVEFWALKCRWWRLSVVFIAHETGEIGGHPGVNFERIKPPGGKKPRYPQRSIESVFFFSPQPFFPQIDQYRHFQVDNKFLFSVDI